MVGCTEQPATVSPESTPRLEPIITTPEKEKDSIVEKEELKEPLIRHLEELSLVEPSKSYTSVKRAIERERGQLISKELEMDVLSMLFKTALLNKIIPFWEGTEWSFEGHTSKPKSGTIACGYFVSTTLQHIGLNINRYKLAQQSPINEATSLAVNINVKEFSAPSNTQNIAAIHAYLKEGIHFIGFDQSHVGFILKEKGHLYLIHSNYSDGVGVGIEPIEQSVVFDSYNRFYITELSTNVSLVSHWIEGKAIPIIKVEN
ncbi:MAG: hypothetical protein ACRBFS_05735 [Aureispira sp.]